MAAEIVPISLGLTEGTGVTLWAPTWREDGEDWEAFLGAGDDLFLFPTVAHLAAFIRTAGDHDLIDHPEWPSAARFLADELTPDDDHRFDIIGVPDLVAETPDIWTLAELADTVAILRSLAEVCDIAVIEEVLGASDGFAALALGEQAFAGRTGEKLWDEIGAVVAERWDDVVDALDQLVATPEVDAAALETAQREVAAMEAAVAAAAAENVQDLEDEFGADAADVVDLERDTAEPAEERDADLLFWEQAGIDCIEITVSGRTGWSLRGYLDDEPVFLSRGGRILTFSSPEGLEDFIAEPGARHRLSELNFWAEVRDAVSGGDAAVLVDAANTYRLDGLAEQLLTGPGAVDADQLELAVELLTDAADARGDSETADALSSATPLGNLIGSITSDDPDRLAPAPPYGDEVAAWAVLVDRFATTLDWDPAAR
jgi:hypothetical protein